MLSLTHKPRKLRPFILTCDERLDTFKTFVESYNNIKDSMLQPIVLAGYNHPDRKTAYNQLIYSLDPHVVLKQGDYYSGVDASREFRRLAYAYRHKAYLNIQKIMTKNFPNFALRNSNANEDIIFFEDDGLFSSQFPMIVQNVSQYLQSDCDLLTLYSPQHGYETLDGLPADDLVHPIDGRSYYGNICVAFSRETIKFLGQHWKDVQACSTAWDCRWGISLHNAGFKLYATRNTYVQHQTGYSILEKNIKEEASKIFVK